MTLNASFSSQAFPVVIMAKRIRARWLLPAGSMSRACALLRHPITNAVTEGLNSKIQSLKANARGFRSFEHYRIRILFHCGKLDLNPL